jgi:hypothetical protein
MICKYYIKYAVKSDKEAYSETVCVCKICELINKYHLLIEKSGKNYTATQQLFLYKNLDVNPILLERVTHLIFYTKKPLLIRGDKQRLFVYISCQIYKDTATSSVYKIRSIF